MPSLITAGGVSDYFGQTGGADGALTIQTGPTGAKVNAIALASDGTMTLLKPMSGGSLTLGTPQNTTSGTSIDFTGIPSWVKRITVMLNGVSLSGTAFPLFRVGAGTIQTSGYASATTVTVSTGVGAAISTSGVQFSMGSGSGATYPWTGHILCTHMGGNSWIISGCLGTSIGSGQIAFATSSVTLSGVLDRVSLSNTGADTFDAGSVNIMYEG